MSDLSYSKKHLIIDIVAVVVGAFVLMYWAFDNGFVLFFGDSGGYIERAFNGLLSNHWAMFYSLFIKWTSLNGWSLWGVAFFQNLIISFLLYQILTLFPYRYWYRVAAFAILLFLLNFLSSLPWISNMMMSDIFTGIGVLSLILLMVKSHQKVVFWALFTLFIFGVLAHKSHAPILGLLLLVCTMLSFIYQRYIKRKSKKDHLITLAIIWVGFIAGSTFLKPVVNWLIAGDHYQHVEAADNSQSKLKTANSEYHFVWRTLRRMKIYNSVLETYCPTENWKILCNKKEMQRRGRNGFKDDLWAGDNFSAEVEKMGKAVLTDPHYIYLLAKDGINRGLHLSRLHRFPISAKPLPTERRKKKVLQYFDKDITYYENSKAASGWQMKRIRRDLHSITNFILNKWRWLALLFTAIIIFLSPKKETIVPLLIGTFAILVAYYINCILMATFSTMHNIRYSGRLTWTLTLILVLQLLYIAHLLGPSLTTFFKPKRESTEA